MRLYILRHGDAPFASLSGERVLSSLGESQTAQVVSDRAAELSDIPVVTCSPVRRARETLAVFNRIISTPSETIFDDCLLSESSVGRVERYCESLDQPSRAQAPLLLISHQPLVGQLLEYLTDQRGIGMRMGTSCLACLDLITFSRGCGQLNWLDYPL